MLMANAPSSMPSLWNYISDMIVYWYVLGLLKFLNWDHLVVCKILSKNNVITFWDISRWDQTVVTKRM